MAYFLMDIAYRRATFIITRHGKMEDNMIYATKERAEQVAAELNQRKGYFPARAALTVHGWTVCTVNPSCRYRIEGEIY
jgi:hypothetical protein